MGTPGDVQIFGVRSFAGTPVEAARAVVERARSGDGGHACLCNVHLLMTAQDDLRVRGALASAWSVFADGAPVAWLQRRAGAAHARRVGGADLVTLVLALGEPAGLRHFLLGATPGVLARLEERISQEFPHALVVGSHAPPFAPVDARALDDAADAVRAARPEVVWCAFGAPKQELWMARHADALTPALLLGVGAAFDFLSGTKARAPQWMQRSSLEWLHRLATEPRRLAGRYVRTNGEFVWRAGRELSRRRWAA